MDDKTLITQILEGDQAAFSALVERYQTPVYNQILRMTGNEQDALELAQETFLRAWRGLAWFHFESKFSTWLYRLAANCCIDFLRRQKKQRTVSLTTDDAAVTDIPDRQMTPEEQLLRQERQTAIQRAMALLAAEHRQILTLRVINDLDYAQIADVLDVPVGTVKSRLARARMQLRKKMQELGNQPAPYSSISTGKEDA